MYLLLLFRLTVELVQRAEHAGVSWISVHGRTVQQRTEPVSLEAIKLVCVYVYACVCVCVHVWYVHLFLHVPMSLCMYLCLLGCLCVHDVIPISCIKVKESVRVPVVANGDVFTMSDVERVHQATGVDGVMSARGMLENPAMYAGFDCTPVQCVQDWVRGCATCVVQVHAVCDGWVVSGTDMRIC